MKIYTIFPVKIELEEILLFEIYRKTVPNITPMLETIMLSVLAIGWLSSVIKSGIKGQNLYMPPIVINIADIRYPEKGDSSPNGHVMPHGSKNMPIL